MRNISDTIRRLAALKGLPGLSATGLNGNRLEDLSGFGSNPGALRGYRYVPANLTKDAPLVVVLHGCTQSAGGYDQGAGWSALSDLHGFALLFPEQQRSNNANLCFNWFVPEDVRRDAGEALSIRQMVEAMIVMHGLDRRRIFVNGLSAGGAMASVMLAAYPDVFAGGAIIAGLPYGCASTVPEAFDRMRGDGGPSDAALEALLRRASRHDGPWPTVSIWHGDADHTVVPSNADRIIAQWRSVHQLAVQPTVVESGARHRRRVWFDSGRRAVIEARNISGMGHGTPINTKGVEGHGAARPFMLDVGISSTLEIARFWGLISAEVAREATSRPASRTVVQDNPGQAVAALTPVKARDKGIGKVIEDALRAAGLMRKE
jgi:poly(hydroxyalkanoate) depolymerase family esterase